ncbi:MAG: hypothetical protein IBX55_01095 [Methyloprofundus sp.]|nr:hypothetical protein [Methyloprofundus sp.]
MTLKGLNLFSDEAVSYMERLISSRLSRETCINLDLDDFLILAKKQEGGLDESVISELKTVVSSGAGFSDLPFLKFVHDGEGMAFIIGHEGRHRAQALKEMGYVSMPVILKSIESSEGPGIRWGVQGDSSRPYDQVKMPSRIVSEDGDYEGRFPLTSHGLVEMNLSKSSYKDYISSISGEGSVFSICND